MFGKAGGPQPPSFSSDQWPTPLSEAAYYGPMGDIVKALTKIDHDGLPILLVPGLVTENDAMPDVMRGEETQILGATLGTKRVTCSIPAFGPAPKASCNSRSTKTFYINRLLRG
jgi:hypothetical protein